MQQNPTHEKLKRMVAMSLLVAIVVVLQLVGSSFRIGPIPFSLVLVPIAVGAVLYGPSAGAVLGAAFGIVVLIGGITGTDQFTFFLWTASPFWTAMVCLGKGVLAGLCSGWIAKLLHKKQTLACISAAVVCPIVNTGIFALAMSTVLRESLIELAGGAQSGGELMAFLFTVLIGINFFVEFGFNAVLSAAISRIVRFAQKK